MERDFKYTIRKVMLVGTAGLALIFGGVACNDEGADNGGVVEGGGEVQDD